VSNRLSTICSSLAICAVLMLGACSSLQGLGGLITNQHPAWAANSAACATLSTGIATVLTDAPMGIAAAAEIGKSVCDVEASLVAGPQAQVTVTSSTVTGTTQQAPTPTLAPVPAAVAPPAPLVVAPKSG
jgi:hypothetical protein